MTERISLYVGPRGKLCGAGSAPISPRDLPVLQYGTVTGIDFPDLPVAAGTTYQLALDVDLDFSEKSLGALEDVTPEQDGTGLSFDVNLRTYKLRDAILDHPAVTVWMQLAAIAPDGSASILLLDRLTLRGLVADPVGDYNVVNVPSPGTDQPLAPTVTVTKVGSTTTITASDINGTTSATIEDGDPNDWIVPDTNN